MPTIKVTALLDNCAARPMLHQWKVSLVFTGANCQNSCGRWIEHPEIHATTPSNTFTIPFGAVRGGDLTIQVTVQTGAGSVIGFSDGLRIVGTNPSTGALLREAIMTDAFKRLMRLESGLRQFKPACCPFFSNDQLGGVGLCQITVPPPTDDQVWNWKANLQRGLELYRQKEAAARAYPRHIRLSKEFKDLVDMYNRARVREYTCRSTSAASHRPPGLYSGPTRTRYHSGLQRLRGKRARS